MRVSRLLPFLLVGLLAPSSASAATRYASPFSVDTSGNCDITACRLDRALEQTQPGEQLLLEDGPYNVNYQATTNKAVTIRPAFAGTHPRLIGAPNLGYPTLELSAGGSVTGLRIETSSAVALQLGGGAKGVGLELLADATNANAV